MYQLKSPFAITREQSQAVQAIAGNYQAGRRRQVLLGVTGSGKTFIMAHLIQSLGLPTLVLSPNKVLAAQLYQEFRDFFSEDRVGYFISYYDYYLPEAFIPSRNQYISKEVSINAELERLRIEAISHLLDSRHTIIVASVSAIYSIGSPEEFQEQKVPYQVGQPIQQDNTLRNWVSLGYSRTEEFLESGYFRQRGNQLEIFPTSEENPFRLICGPNTVMRIERFDPVTGGPIETLDSIIIYPVNYFHYRQQKIDEVIPAIQAELTERITFFEKQNQPEYARRIRERTLFDLEMLKIYGYCTGVENYSRHLTGRRPGEPPFTILDFFQGDFLTIIDESHLAIPQLGGMYSGDQSRKKTLVDFGFRLPSALDNRPLNFTEFNERIKKVLYVSATPDEYEIQASGGQVTELLVRPTGLVDPLIETRQRDNPAEDALLEIRHELAGQNRVLITTLTKKEAEQFAEYLLQNEISCAYLHSEIKALDRIQLIRKLRLGEIEVLVGINLLREGLDLPEVSLVIIMNADREGFLRSRTSLIQTFGRASRHLSGRVIAYCDGLTGSLEQAIAESRRRREFQLSYNRKHGIIPRSISKGVRGFYEEDYWLNKTDQDLPPDHFKTRESLQKEIDRLTKQMKAKAAGLEFQAAAALRDQIKRLKNYSIDMF